MCTKKFATKRKVQIHFKSIHEKIKCDYCDKSFSQIANLNRHIRTIHKGQNNYKCESCGKLFTRNDNLKLHIHTIHESTKEKFPKAGQDFFPCSSCKIKFRSLAKNRLHELKCVGFLRCPECQKFFHLNRSPATLYLSHYEFKRHMKNTHDIDLKAQDKESKPYKCRICSTSFAQKKHLSAHEGRFHKSE